MTADRDLTIDQAAALLGLSREGVRSRLRRGLLRGERRNGAWFVFAVAGQPVTVTTPDRADQSDRPDRLDRPRRAAARSALVARLEADVAFLQAEVERRDRELEQAAVERAELRRLLAAQMPALPATSTETPSSAPVDAETTTQSQTPRRPWWRAWRR